MSALTTPFKRVLEILSNAVRQEKERQGKETGKEDIKLCVDNDMNIYIEI